MVDQRSLAATLTGSGGWGVQSVRLYVANDLSYERSFAPRGRLVEMIEGPVPLSATNKGARVTEED